MDLGTAVASAWSSGISVYGVAALLGIAGRLRWIDSPDLLRSPWLIVIAAALFLVELVVDKIPYVDSAWDAVHLVIRPVIGGYLVTTTGNTQLSVPALAVVGVALALSSHAAKSSTRLLINASPEPISNVVASVAEDGLVAGVMTLAIVAPRVAFVVALVLAVLSTIVAVLVFRSARRVRARWRERRNRSVRNRQR